MSSHGSQVAKKTPTSKVAKPKTAGAKKTSAKKPKVAKKPKSAKKAAAPKAKKTTATKKVRRQLLADYGQSMSTAASVLKLKALNSRC